MSTIKCGFFNSKNNDRTYTAEDMNKPYELLVSNGVFATQKGTPSNYLQVYASSGLEITVKAGRGIFADKWFLLDGDMPLSVEAGNVTQSRIDSVVVRVDLNEAVRNASIIIKKGTPASRPVAPSLTRTSLVMEYRLANILVAPNVTAVKQVDITDTRMTADCGWVTSLVQQVDTSTLYIQWQNAFDAWFSNVKETLSTATLIRSYENTHTTTVQNQVNIPIGISQFNMNLDILQVYINGLMLIKGVEYTVTNNSTIKLTMGVSTGTPVSFIVYKSVDGSDAETVVQQVYELQNVVDASIITDVNGSTKLNITDTSKNVLTEFAGLGVGVHTIYCASGVQGLPRSGAFRTIGHLNNATNGWIMAFYTNGSVYVNYMLAGEWVGWKVIYETVQTALWTGESYLNATATVTPSKKLSECAHGWTLMFSDYDDDTSTSNNSDVCAVNVPKHTVTGGTWNGSSFLCVIPTTVSEAGEHSLCVKRFYIYDNRITGYAGNNTGAVQRDAVLRAIYEY